MINPLEPILGFGTAGISTLAIWLAESAPASIEPALQTGGTVGLIGGLTVALIAVWRDRAALVAEIKSEREARLSDAKESNRQYREDSAQGERSRQELIREMRTQTAAIKGEKS